MPRSEEVWAIIYYQGKEVDSMTQTGGVLKALPYRYVIAGAA